MDATIMTCDILRRNHRLVEAELLCRRALSRGHTETVLRAMSNLLLDQIVSHLVSYRSYDHTHTHTHICPRLKYRRRTIVWCHGIESSWMISFHQRMMTRYLLRSTS